MTTNDYERDFENPSSRLRLPGRFDPRLLQNLDDVGDGSPGLQKAMRNWHNVNKFESSDYDVYYCSTEAEITQALTDIGNGIGIIQLYGGTITLTGEISINGAGSCIIQGDGVYSIIDCGGDNRAFNIGTNPSGVILRDFSIDANDLTTSTVEVIYVNATASQQTIIDGVWIYGDGTNGTGIETTGASVDHVIIKNCRISSLNIGIQNAGNYNIIKNCEINACASEGIYNTGAYNNIIGNTCYSNSEGIYLTGNNYNNINSNVCLTNTNNGIYLDAFSGKNNINGNVCGGNDTGIYVFSSSPVNNITGNMCENNVTYGIRLNACDYNIINGNNCNDNVSGIYFTTSNFNTISNNNCSDNDSSGGSPHGGIFISSGSDNLIANNTCVNNNNSGASTGYGIIIGGGNRNQVKNNRVNGNDISYLEQGTNTRMEVDCFTEAEISDITTSGTFNSAIINLPNGTITLTGAINISGGGSYIIQGQGDETIIDCGGNNKAFYITSVTNCVLRDFKIDAADLTTSTTEIIDVTESTNDPVIIDNVTILGDGTNGYGIELNSDNCVVKNCVIDSVGDGIYIQSNNNKITSNTVKDCALVGINFYPSAAVKYYNIISNNHCYSNGESGIRLGGYAQFSTITGNVCNDNTEHGIFCWACDYNTISGNNCSNNTEDGIHLDDAQYNIVIGNICRANNGNTTRDGGGIYLRDNSDYNNINGNNCSVNVNIGSGTSYGIAVYSAACNENMVSGNNCQGNDTEYIDTGTGTVDDSSDGTTNANLNRFD